jgi:hypothetical protein
MHYRSLIGAIAVAALLVPVGGARADDAKYPDWKGAWARFVVRGLGGQPSFDQTKPWGFGQQAPLTEEYRKVLEASIADQAQGGQGNFAGHALCLPAGMPLMMIAFRPLEFVVTPETTYILIGGSDHYRRIFTDGRDWPKEVEPSFRGYSIGKWLDEDGDGKYDALEVETRYFKGPRAYDTTGLPLHNDNQTVVKERIRFDKADPNLFYDDITTIDHALTKPWTVTKTYRRLDNPQPEWLEMNCAENNTHIHLGNENYYLGADGLLMPTKKNQTPPDLKWFKVQKN